MSECGCRERMYATLRAIATILDARDEQSVVEGAGQSLVATAERLAQDPPKCHLCEHGEA